ncbi:MAG: hypothetical protein ACRDC4_16220 [Plesiomonas sp.]
MNLNKLALKERVYALMEGDTLHLAINEIKQQIALDIVHTNFDQTTKREELYMLTKALDALQMKLQEYVNDVERSKETE